MTTTLDRFKVSALLALLAGYLVLGYAFMLLRIPPTGFGIPLGELLLVVVLLGIDPRRILSRMKAVVMLVPFLLWWGWGLAHLAFNTAERGYWALRDGTQLIESLFMIVGFSLAADPGTMQRLARWLRPILIISCLYGLLFVVGTQIAAISPTIPDASGYPVPIFGDFAMSDTMLLWGAFACLTAPADRPAVRLLRTLLAGFLIAYAVAVLQMRTTYLQLLAMSALLLLVRPKALGRLGIAIPLLLFLLLVVDAFNIRISGRLTSNISLAFFWDHILAIFGIGAKGQGAIAGAASGVPLRLHWWTRIYEQLTADPVTLLTGLGYGVPLTDFRDTSGGIVREPHNSIISVVARVGVVGFMAWIWMQAELFRAGFCAYRESRRRGLYKAARLCLLILVFAILTLVGCVGEDNMEKPYFAIPYYAFWGIVLRMAYRLRAEARAGAQSGAREPFSPREAVAMPHPRAP